MQQMQPNRPRFLHHPYGSPIRYRHYSAKNKGKFREKQRLGLCFACKERLTPATLIKITIRTPNQSYHFLAVVSWCYRSTDGYEAGVNFLREDDAFRARMAEQVCHIEDYRVRVKKEEGRELTSEAAAKEWIGRYAASFPDMG